MKSISSERQRVIGEVSRWLCEKKRVRERASTKDAKGRLLKFVNGIYCEQLSLSNWSEALKVIWSQVVLSFASWMLAQSASFVTDIPCSRIVYTCSVCPHLNPASISDVDSCEMPPDNRLSYFLRDFETFNSTNSKIIIIAGLINWYIGWFL